MLKGHGELRMANQKTLAYDGVMARIAQVKRLLIRTPVE